MVLPWPVLIALVFGGTIAWAAWVVFRSREWPYADEPLWGRLFYFVLFALVIGGVATGSSSGGRPPQTETLPV